jgi:hypothetical protein
MPDPTTELLGQMSPARLSEEAISDYRRLLSDPAFERDHPEHYAALKASVTEALAATGQDQVPTDPRTPAQRLLDRQLGVEPRKASDYEVAVSQATGSDIAQPAKELLAALHIDPLLGNVILRDVLGRSGAPDPAEVARQLDAAGISYANAIAEVQRAFDRAGRTSPIKPTDLGAAALAQLFIWTQRLKQHEQQGRR